MNLGMVIATPFFNSTYCPKIEMGYVLLNKNTILKGIIVVKNEKTTLLTPFFGGMKKLQED